LKEQNKYDQVPSGVFDRLQRILPLAETVVYEYTEVLEKVILEMFEVIQRIAKCTCDYVKRGRFGKQSPFLDLAMLMIVARTVGGLVRPATIEELDRDLSKVIEDFDRAVNVETLRLAQSNGQHSLSQFGGGSFPPPPCRTSWRRPFA
jgi:hypothetical protein